MRYDVLVLGGGAAGCALAARLSENPDRTVCLVEAGPDYGHLSEGRWPADILDPRWLALESHLWERDDEGDRSQSRARVVGGCSAHNACVLLEGAPADYEWGGCWSYEAFAPYLRRAYETLRGHVLADDELTPWHRAFRDAGGADSIVHPVNIVDGVRWHTGFAYLDAARARENLTVLGDTLVDRVPVSGARALGALAGGRELRADAVVVSAGAYGSPGILLRSGIGPAGDVAQLPVGEGLVDHVGTGAAWEPTQRLLDETAAHEAEHGLYMGQVTVAGRSRSCPPGTRDLFVFPALDVGPEISGAAFAMKPRSQGSVRLNGPDPETPLRIDHGFLRDERDVETVAEAFERLRELAESDPVRPYRGAELRPGAGVGAEEHVRASARGFFHPVGTCAIGRAVDERCRVLGFENLYVVDASAIPEIPSANTNLTTVALAERAAEWV
ncbi:MAG TPA: GMC family oxidoreductase [Gaiellaceae bacterium]|nr:GMC family oxidoreductase [Gaiellaceae bacterium]